LFAFPIIICFHELVNLSKGKRKGKAEGRAREGKVGKRSGNGFSHSLFPFSSLPLPSLFPGVELFELRLRYKCLRAKPEEDT
jgi:hypothetical protein